MIDDSTNLAPPFLGQGFPAYPQVNQICRVYASNVIATNVYPAFVAQFAPPLSLRDRESCYVWEVNGIAIGPGYYDCRLIGAYAGLPLYATNCCPTGGFSSSSSSSRSGR